MSSKTSLNRDQKITLLSEILTIEQLAKSRIDALLPSGMELSHLSVLNYLAHGQRERTPSHLAQTFSVTRGAMTNTLNRLEGAGHIHVRPDWDDARRKQISISPAGLAVRNASLENIDKALLQEEPAIAPSELRTCLLVLRQVRVSLVDT